MPRNAAPNATPVMAFSATGISSTRVGPYFSTSPLVEAKMAAGSGAPRPMIKTRGSLVMHRSSASFSAWTNFNCRVLAVALILPSWSVKMGGQLIARRERAGLGKGNGLVDLGVDRLFHDSDIGIAHDAMLAQAAGIELQRIARFPGFELAGRAVPQMLILERATMFVPAIGLELQKGRALAGPRALDRLTGQGVHRIRIVAVGLPVEHAVSLSKLDDLTVLRLTHAQGRQQRIEVVLAHHNHGKLMKSGNVETFVKDSGLGRRVAEEDDGEERIPLEHRTERCPNPDRNGASHDRHCAEEPHRAVDEMHGATLAGGTASRLAVEFCQHTLEVASFGQVMGVAAMGGRDQLLPLQMSTHANRHGFLPDTEMGGAAHFLLGVKLPDTLFDQADPHDAVQHPSRNVGGGLSILHDAFLCELGCGRIGGTIKRAACNRWASP